MEQKGALAEFEGERAQLLAQLQVLEDQLQEKGRQLQETEEQVGTLLVDCVVNCTICVCVCIQPNYYINHGFSS